FYQYPTVGIIAWRTGAALIADRADLPQHQIRARVDAALVIEQLAGLVMLAAECAGVDTQVRVQAILGRDARLHVRGETFLARDADGFVRRPREHARVAVERGADFFARTHFGQDRVRHLAVGFRARFAFGVERLKAAHIRMQRFDPLLDDAIRHGEKHHVGLLDVTARQRRQMRAERNADADAGEGAFAFPSGFHAQYAAPPSSR